MTQVMSPITQEALPAQARPFLREGTPPKKRLFAARGSLPLPPAQLGIVLYFCTFDGERAVRRAAHESFRNLPPQIRKNLIEQTTHPGVLHWICRNLLEPALLAEGRELPVETQDALREIVLNRHVDSRTLAMIAEHCPDEGIVGIVAQNQSKILEHPEIFLALERNPRVPVSVLDPLRTFLRLENVLTGEEAASASEEQVRTIEEELDRLLSGDLFDLGRWFQEQLDIPMELKEAAFDPAAEVPEEDDNAELLKGNLFVTLGKLKVSQRVLLAFTGNSLVRTVLLKDRNRIVRRFVLRNPKITPKEIETVCKDRQQDTEVISTVANNREWTRNYNIRRLLCYHPKTPVVQALRFVNTLYRRDLQLLARSKDVPSHVVSAARRRIMSS